MNTLQLKDQISNKELARHFLGSPVKTTSAGDWYLSPFRNETVPSFLVSEKGIHDFGSSEHFDSIGLIQKLLNISFKQALEVIAREFGIYEEEKPNPRLQKYLNDRRMQKAYLTEKLAEWYNLSFSKLKSVLHTNTRLYTGLKGKVLIPNFEDRKDKSEIANRYYERYGDSLSYLSDQNIKLEILLDEFVDCKDKEKLYEDYEEGVRKIE